MTQTVQGFLVAPDASGSKVVNIPTDSLEQILAWDGDFIDYISLTYNGTEFRQTFTNDGTNITNISQWLEYVP